MRRLIGWLHVQLTMFFLTRRGWLLWKLNVYLANIWERKQTFKEVNKIIRSLDLSFESRVLVIGASFGTLQVLSPLDQFSEIIATDVDPRTIRQIRAKYTKRSKVAPNAAFYPEGLDTSLIQIGQFKLVICFSLDKALSRKKTLERLESLVEPGGFMLLVLPNLQERFEEMIIRHKRMGANPPAYRLFFAYYLAKLLSRNYSVQRQSRFFTYKDVLDLNFSRGNVSSSFVENGTQSNWVVTWKNLPLAEKVACQVSI